MSNAQCACGALKLSFSEAPQLTALCHCLACQRRTGSVFSANAFFAVEAVTIDGQTQEFIRKGDSGRKVHMHFCPACGSTVFWRAEAAPHWIGVAVGAFADPSYPAPTLSVFETSKHDWVGLGDEIKHFAALP